MTMNSQQVSSSPGSTWGGVALVAAGALCFSSAIVFARSLQGLDALTIAFFRALAAFLFFSALIPRYPSMIRFRSYRSALKVLTALGIAMGMTAILYVFALQRTTAANAVLLNNTSVLYVALLAPWLLQESRPRFVWLSLALALAGILLITGPSQLDLGEGNSLGVAAGAVSGVTLGCVLLASRYLREQVQGVTQVWWGTGIAALLALPGLLTISWSMLLARLPLLLLMGVASLGVPYLLYFLGLRQLRAQVASIVALLEPVTGVLIGIFVYKEVPDLPGFLGILLVLLSIFLVTRRKPRRPRVD